MRALVLVDPAPQQLCLALVQHDQHGEPGEGGHFQLIFMFASKFPAGAAAARAITAAATYGNSLQGHSISRSGSGRNRNLARRPAAQGASAARAHWGARPTMSTSGLLVLLSAPLGATRSSSSISCGGLSFEPPVLLGPCTSFGVQATLPLSSSSPAGPAFAALLGVSTVVLSTDGGHTFTPHTFGPGFTLPEYPLVVGAKGSNSWHDFGNVSHSQPKTTRPTYFNFTAAAVNRFSWADGKLSWSQNSHTTFFGGLPYGAGDELYTRAPLRLQGGGQVTLRDGSLLHSGSVWWPECTPSCLPIPKQTLDMMGASASLRTTVRGVYTVLSDTQIGQHYLSHANMTIAAAEIKCSAEAACTGFCFQAPAAPGTDAAAVPSPPQESVEMFFKRSHGTFSSKGWTTYMKNHSAPAPAPPLPPGHAKTNCCPGNAASTHGTSSIAFRSTDGGFHWDYLSTIIDARSIPTSEEGCSEHDIVRLQSGAILMVCRTDAGDGEETHKSSNYARVLSTDEGRTWSYPEYLNAGSARPRLLATTASEPAAAAAAAASSSAAEARATKEIIIMAGGRWGTAGSGYAHNPPLPKPSPDGLPGQTDWTTANRSMEPTIFLDDSGSEGLNWTAHSVSYWHNRLA